MWKIIYSLGILACLEAHASSADLLLSGKVVSVEDSQTGSEVVQKGGTAKAKLTVTLVAGGTQERDVRELIKQKLPRFIKGWIEAKNSRSSQIVQSVPVTFFSNPDSVRCKNSMSGDKVICQVSFRNESNNTVEIPAQMTGSHSLNVSFKEPLNGSSMLLKRGPNIQYFVDGKGPKSFATFAGLPEN